MSKTMRKRAAVRRSLRTLAAVLVLAAGSASLAPAHAHGGDDHAEPAPAGSGPQRLPDGSVFLPKPAQRQLQLRTLAVVQADLARATELTGQVVMDPNAGGRVQAALAGRVEPGPGGLPAVGQRVRKGELLAWVQPQVDAIERSNQLAQLAELRSARTLAAQRLQRLQALADTVPRKDIEAAQADLQSLDGRLAALDAGLGSRDALRAPASGVVASAFAVAGQVVDAGELLFEVVDPTRLRVEALAYELERADDIASASALLGGQTLPLRFIGAARSLREQALPLQFGASGPALAQLGALALGQPVRVLIQSRTRRAGFALPSAALMKSPANQDIVWVKVAPERFEPRVVGFEPLDGSQVVITRGLRAGERVTTEGATLVNQIR